MSSQLDFIFFFYGLAFILLGVTCFAIARIPGRQEPWLVLGVFGFVHGASEWLDLTALVIGNSLLFAAARTALVTGSFMLLMEFARLELIRLGLKLPDRWVYLLLALLVVFGGALGGPTTAGVVARYSTGFVAAMATSAVFVWHAKELSGPTRGLAAVAAVGFALYAVAAGVIVPAAAFWPANQFNYGWFTHLTSLPIQLLRGLLACAIAFSIWGIWGQLLVLEVSTARYAAYLRNQFIWTLVTMGTILVLGWMLTEFLGGVYRQNVQEEARGDIDLLASHLAGETAVVEGMVKSLAGTPSVRPLLNGGSQQDVALALAILDLDVEASGAKLGFLLDGSGKVVAASDRRMTTSPVAANKRASSYFQTSIAGAPGYHFDFDAASKELAYFASYPVRAEDGAIVGVAVLKKTFEGLSADLSEFGRAYFFVDPDGIVVLTNRPKMLLKTLWPLSAEKRSAAARRFGELDGRPVVEKEIADAKWANFNGERDYLRRRYARHSQWSLIIVSQIQEIYASRVLGIVVTLLVTIMTLIYLFGRERWVRDVEEMDKRQKLQDLTWDLRLQATTDSLTGLSNRLKFDQVLARELLRAERYKTPLSLVMYDIDQFKAINDRYGHQSGDKVLIELARVVSSNIRETDILARWGGEEFALLAPGTDSLTAHQVAEKLRAVIEQTMFKAVGRITCSFGVAEYLDGDTPETFVSRADAALYQAKTNGRNRVEISSPSAAVMPNNGSISSSI